MSCVAGFSFCSRSRFLRLLFFELEPPAIAAGGDEEGGICANRDGGERLKARSAGERRRERRRKEGDAHTGSAAPDGERQAALPFR